MEGRDRRTGKSLQGLGEAWLREKCNDSGHEHGKKVIYFKCI